MCGIPQQKCGREVLGPRIHEWKGSGPTQTHRNRWSATFDPAIETGPGASPFASFWDRHQNFRNFGQLSVKMSSFSALFLTLPKLSPRFVCKFAIFDRFGSHLSTPPASSLHDLYCTLGNGRDTIIEMWTEVLGPRIDELKYLGPTQNIGTVSAPLLTPKQKPGLGHRRSSRFGTGTKTS